MRVLRKRKIRHKIARAGRTAIYRKIGGGSGGAAVGRSIGSGGSELPVASWPSWPKKRLVDGFEFDTNQQFFAEANHCWISVPQAFN